ncbi:unnamed protein product [Boreogadus saida]
MFGVMNSQESQRSALCALLKHSWTRRSVIMSDVMMRVDQGPVLWSGHMGLQVGGQRSEPVLWSGHMGLRVGGQSPSSGRVRAPGEPRGSRAPWGPVRLLWGNSIEIGVADDECGCVS